MSGIPPTVVAAFERILENHRRLTETAQRRESVKSATESTRECHRRHYEYFEEVYYHEEKRRDAFTKSLSFLLGALGIAGTIGAFYLRDLLEWFPTVSATNAFRDWTITLYLVFLLLDSLCLIIASVFLILAFHPYTYEYLASPLDIRRYYQGLLAHHQDPAMAEVAFQQYLTDDYAAAANANDLNNITRRKYQHWCSGAAIVLFLLLALTSIPFFGHSVRHQNKKPLLIQSDSEKAQVRLNRTRRYHEALFLDESWPAVQFSLAFPCVYANDPTTPANTPACTPPPRTETAPPSAPPRRLVRGGSAKRKQG
ncbi:MAG TPA: hypothetical protein VNP98_01335 [Chthoniobacterales bacterium]|nr:hypothetical protein [Chthoniobacterales bacterium]